MDPSHPVLFPLLQKIMPWFRIMPYPISSDPSIGVPPHCRVCKSVVSYADQTATPFRFEWADTCLKSPFWASCSSTLNLFALADDWLEAVTDTIDSGF